MVYWPESVPVIPFIFQNEKIFRPGRVESKMGNGIAGGSENRIVEFAFKILGIFSKHYFVARTAEFVGGGVIADRVYMVTSNEPNPG